MADLYLHDDTEHGDLSDWIQRVAEGEDDDLPAWWDAAGAWLAGLKPPAYPHVEPIPAHYVESIRFVVSDWAEVLRSNDEESHSEVRED